MAQYPEWLMKYKTKGVYAQKTKNGYALYRGHSERTKDRSYPVLKCDEYMGIVTEEGGLMPSSPSVKPGIRVLRYGLYAIAEDACAILRRTPANRGYDAGLIYSHALLAVEGMDTQRGYEGSWLSVAHPGLDMHGELADDTASMVARVATQVRSKLASRYGEDLGEAMILAAGLYAVHVNGHWHMSDVDPALADIAARHGISLGKHIDKHI